MNLNMGILECEECHDRFSCRVGMSNRHKQEFSICCKNCGALSSITIDENKNISYKGLEKVELSALEGEYSYHLDLHLDFPVFESEKWHPFSPFTVSAMLSDDQSIGHHAYNMNSLNEISENLSAVKNILNFYQRSKFDLFNNKVNEYLSIKSTVSSDIQAEMLLFKFLYELITPFCDCDIVNDDIDLFINTVSELKNKDKNALDKFLNNLKESNVIKTGIKDTLKIYKSLLEKEVIFRPSLFLSLDGNKNNKKLPYMLSSESFEFIQDLFKDISEVISRQLSIIAGINNLLKRSSHDDFLTVKSKKGKILSPTSLREFSDFDFGKKLDFIDNSWYQISKTIADNQLRNSTAHYKWEYDPISQKVTYYPKKEGMERIDSKEIMLIEYTSKIISSFKIMHRLNFMYHVLSLKINNKI